MTKAKGIIRTKGELELLKIPRGAPTKYDPKYIQMFLDYFNRPAYTVNEYTGKQEATDCPTIAGFAVSIGVSKDTLHQWSKTHQDFSDAYNKASTFQEAWLSTNGNKGLINPQFAIFTAKNIINWRDKRDVEITGNVTNLSDEDLEKKLAEKLKK